MPNKALLKLSFIALFAALIAAGTFIAIPIGPVPIVLQNLFALLSGLILGPFMGAASAALYLFAGLAGAPVFAGFTGGVARFAGPTGGFLAGYFLMPLTAGLIAGKHQNKLSKARLTAAVISGLLAVYVPGIAWLKFSTGFGWTKTLIAGFLPFIPGDIVKGIAAVLITPRLRKTAAEHLYG